MPRLLRRYHGAGDLHFITSSCYRRQPLLGTVRRRDLLLKILEQVRRRYRFVVLGYVIMPEHFHVLISEAQRGTPSTLMQAVKLGFARRVLAERKRQRVCGQGELWEGGREHIWQARFYDFNVWTEHKRIEKLRYMHNNPVKRGLVLQPEQWRWSSFRSYVYGESGLVRINDCGVLNMRLQARCVNAWCGVRAGSRVSKTARRGAPPLRVSVYNLRQMWATRPIDRAATGSAKGRATEGS